MTKALIATLQGQLCTIIN